VLEKSIEALRLAKEVALKGNKNSLSDAGVAGLTAQAAAEGAYYNIKINLPDIQDSEFKSKINKQATSLKNKSIKLGDELREFIEKELE
jgi:glutamate formiminotransferase/formiminotetrahydrofolate cyclodeaminase